tara:strand:+ start:2515 stop:2820 length:306 start_codon:yes stop_codon:yes gene_type:complete
MPQRQQTIWEHIEPKDGENIRMSRALHATDRNVEEADHPRLRGQNAMILARLQRGPATNAELSTISLKYTSRISDLRAAGFEVTCERVKGGTTLYRLGGEQ